MTIGDATAEGAEALRGCTILVVEDEAIVAMDLTQAIEEAGARPLGPAGRVSDALSLVERLDTPPDGAILDVHLAGQDVFPVAERLVALGVPFLFHTGHATRAALEARFPGVTVCTKPALSERLLAELREVMAGHAAG